MHTITIGGNATNGVMPYTMDHVSEEDITGIVNMTRGRAIAVDGLPVTYFGA